MPIIDEKIIREIGYQIEPNRDSMSESERSTFRKLIESITTKELKVRKINAAVEEMKVIGHLVKDEVNSNTKKKLLDRFFKLGKIINNV